MVIAWLMPSSSDEELKMKITKNVVLLLAIAVLMLAGCVPPGTVEAPEETEGPVEYVEHCIDFSGYQSGHSFGTSFTLDSVQFSALGAGDLIVHVSGSGMHHIIFDNDGVRIDFPEPTPRVFLIAGAMAGDDSLVSIMARDSDDNAPYFQRIPGGYDQVDVDLGGLEYDPIITYVEMTGGDGEGLLYEICWWGR
jgi:hypothetical protein